MIKQFRGFLIFNVKTGDVKYRKRKFEKRLSPYEIVTSLNVVVEKEPDVIEEIDNKIIIKKTQLKEIMIDQL